MPLGLKVLSFFKTLFGQGHMAIRRLTFFKIVRIFYRSLVKIS